MLPSSLILALAGLASFTSAVPTTRRQGGGKRGLAFAKGTADKANMFHTGKVSWGYSWEARASQTPVGYTLPGMEFVPMLHDGSPMFVNAFEADTKAAIAAGSTHILSINEPDQCGE